MNLSEKYFIKKALQLTATTTDLGNNFNGKILGICEIW